LPTAGDPDPRTMPLIEGILQNYAQRPGGFPALLQELTARFDAAHPPKFRTEVLNSLNPLRLLWARLEEMYRLSTREEDRHVTAQDHCTTPGGQTRTPGQRADKSGRWYPNMPDTFDDLQSGFRVPPRLSDLLGDS
jgi:hypothetical protein